ncbi:hypothetical protein A7K93_10190 [Candidatus Methylacidiphilum fumarolicum]|nr:hypothetical protein A7K73_08720 [Candidatus Methylacidiphilum fumarolicum]TFE71750.1 hypothetical protein A7K93_10190 [Candidatus Methylacidiphilum fumarolicum]TFE71875.1 hypothetical protein A7K72_10030 [Candidatus Methylacidiphilum fumarolicum]TFE76452.1 hypothetical protein A7D33_10035 [Candidatus Methylacidiphilum fumarolicum]
MRKKARAKLSRLHARIANIWQDAWHKLTSNLIRFLHHIDFEDENGRGRLKCQPKALATENKGALEFDENWNTRRNGAMGYLWTCPVCGSLQDREANEAMHLLASGFTVQSGSTVNSARCEA